MDTSFRPNDFWDHLGGCVKKIVLLLFLTTLLHSAVTFLFSYDNVLPRRAVIKVIKEVAVILLCLISAEWPMHIYDIKVRPTLTLLAQILM